VSESAARTHAPARMTHVAVRCHDVPASIDFYRRYAGLQLVHERDDHGVQVVWLSHRREHPDFVIVLMSMPHEAVQEPSPMDHFGFDVGSREEVDRIAELARAEGRLKLGPLDAGPIVGYIALVRDPSGNSCEFSHGQAIQPESEV
jgi:catechol 2,3-dioxygenase-like lactoylglutathione lyase family enzyme